MADARRQHSPAGATERGHRTARVASSELVGRAAEVEQLRSLIARLDVGHPQVALVSGEAGFGKSRLIATVTELLRSEQVDVLVGHCLDLGPGGPPYAAMTEALRMADDVSPAVLDALTGAAEVGRPQLFEGVRTALTTLAGRRPVVLVVEDLHWADRATQHLLAYLLTAANEGRWALIGTYRSEEVRRQDALREFLATLGRGPVERVNVPALSAAEVAAQIEGITGRRPTEESVATMHARSGGSPLLVEELVAAESAGIHSVPDYLRDTLLARVETLTADTQELVTAAAVGGAVCDEHLLESVLGWNPARVEDALARSVVAGVLVVTGDRYRFRHELLREVVYAEVLPGRRRDLHRKAATALSSSEATEPATLAHHWYEAGDGEQAARAALHAAANAQRAHAPAAVHAQLERVNALWDDLSAELRSMAGGRAQLLETAAQAAQFGGAWRRAVELGEQAVANSDAPTDAAIRSERLGRHRWADADGDGAVAAYEHAVNVLPDDAPAAVRARVLSGYAWFLAVSFQYDRAVNVARAALAAADRSGEPLQRCRAMVSWAGAQPDPEDAETAARAALDVALAEGTNESVSQAYVALDGALRRQGAMRERAESLQAGLANLPTSEYALRAYLRLYLLDSLLALGRWDEADSVVDQLTALRAGGMKTYYTTAPHAWLAAVRGDAEQARRLARDVATLFAGVPQQPHPAMIALLAEAESALWVSDPVTAAHAAARAAELGSVDPPLAAAAVATGIRSWADVAERARRAGRADEVDQATASARRLRERLPEPVHQPVIRYAALAEAELSRLDGRSDPEAWRAAVHGWDLAEDPYRAAYARWRLGEALVSDRSGRAEAKDVLAEARKTAGALGARPLLEAIEDRESRSRLRRPGADASSDVAAAAAALDLTPREHEILTWVTAGRTNREIADALYLSPRTVATHLSRVMRKLGVSTRTQVADAAHRLGLLPDD